MPRLRSKDKAIDPAQRMWEHQMDAMLESLRAKFPEEELAFIVPSWATFWPDGFFRSIPVFRHTLVPPNQLIGGTFRAMKLKLAELYAQEG